MSVIFSYFNPVSYDLYCDKDRWETTQVGRYIDTYIEGSFPDFKKSEIAIFNVPEYEGSNNFAAESHCNVRAAFYSFYHDNLPSICDLGVLQIMPTRKESFKIIERVCTELISNGVIPLIIGGGHDLSYAVYKSYVALEKFMTLTSVDNKFDIGLEDDNLASFSFFGKMISYKPNFLFHFNNLGYQSYFVSSLASEMLQEMNFDIVRLGDLKNNFNDVEPIMRNTDFLSFDISAIQHAYASANVYASPNGINGEEACKIMRYAGLSDKITAVGLFEYNQKLDSNNQTAYLLAQMLWYFVDGYKMRKNELNPNINNCEKYTVAFEDGKNEINFYKSKISDRWWMGVPFREQGFEELQNYYVACSYRDYEIANKGDIPERWLKTLNKFL